MDNNGGYQTTSLNSYGSLGRFVKFKKGDCPICYGAHSRCKAKDELVFCGKDTSAPGWDNLGPTKCNTWFQYLPSSIREASTEEYRRQRKAEWERAERERLEAYKKSLSESDRDIEHKKLVNQLTLSPEHRELLHNRGFNDADIDRLGYRSVEKFQSLSEPINPNLAGINSIGKGLTYFGTEGILCPIPNALGELAGFKIHNPNWKQENSGKYIWAVSKANKNRKKTASSHLQNGELPMAYHDGGNLSIGFSEGPEFKSALISINRGGVCIGASGGQVQPEQFRRYLKGATQHKDFIIWADSGACQNRQVIANYQVVADLAIAEGFTVKVAWWGQSEKAKGQDPDEFFGEYELIDWEDWIGNYCTISVFTQKTKRQTLTADEFWKKFGAEKAITELQNFISRATWKLWRKNGQPQNIELSAYGTKTLTLLEQADKLRSLATQSQQLALPYSKQNIIEYDGVQLPDLRKRPDNTCIKIKRHDLKKVMAELHHKTEPGSVINLNIPAGMGKSHDFGNLHPADFGADVIYCQSQWRNPTVSSIEENSEPVPSKHGGLKKDMGRYTQDGYPYTRHIKDGEEIEEGIDTAGNCQHFQTFKAVRERGVKLFGGKGSANCENCTEYKNDAGKVACSALLARVCGFESDKPQFLRTHPVNLPTLEESKDKQAPVLILDEADKELIGVTLNSFSVAPGDIWQSWGQLNGKEPKLAELLKPLAEKALELSEDFDKHYGYQLDSLKRSLNLEDIKAVLKSGVFNLDIDLFTFGENQVNRLIKAIAKKVESLLKPDLFQLFKGCNNPIERTERAKNHVVPNWISPLLYALSGSGSLRIDANGLHFSRHSNHFVDKVASASTTFLASASNHLGELAARIKYPAKRMITLELVESDKPDYSNLTIKTIKGLQIQGDRRDEGEDSAMVRLRKLINTITSDRSKTYGVIDSKAYYQQWEERGIQSGYWHSDFTRGGNHFKGKDSLILIGNPYPKIGDLIVDYEATYSRCVNEDFSLDKGFLKFLNRRQDSEQIVQGIGRLRTQNRPNKQLECWVLADRVNLELIEQTYPGAKIEQIDLLEFCPQAAKARDQKIKHLAQYMQEAILSDAPLTRDEVAKSLNFSTGNLSKIVKSLAERAKQPVKQAWKWFKQTVTHALKGTISASDGFCSPDAAWLLDYFPSLLKEVKEKVAEPVEIFEAIALAYEQFGPSAEEIFGHLPVEAAKDFIDFLLGSFGADTLTRSQREEIDEYYRELELATG